MINNAQELLSVIIFGLFMIIFAALTKCIHEDMLPIAAVLLALGLICIAIGLSDLIAMVLIPS